MLPTKHVSQGLTQRVAHIAERMVGAGMCRLSRESERETKRGNKTTAYPALLDISKPATTPLAAPPSAWLSLTYIYSSLSKNPAADMSPCSILAPQCSLFVHGSGV